MPALNPYVILAAVGIWLVSIVGGYFYGTHHEALVYKAAISKQDADASALLAQLTATAAAKDAASAEFARKIDEVTTHETQAINDAHADYDRALAERMRQPPSRPSCVSPGAPKTTDAAHSEAVDAPGIFVREPTLRDLGSLMQEADKLVATMNACHAFAESVGR
jgi:hypothetical protein